MAGMCQTVELKTEFRESSSSLLPNVSVNMHMYVGTILLLPYSMAAQLLDCLWFWIKQLMIVTSFQKTQSTLISAPQQEENTLQNTKIFFLMHSYCFGMSNPHLRVFFPP